MAAWPNLSDLVSNEARDAPVGLVGVPLAAGSVTPGRCDLAPALFRQTLRRIGRYDVETSRELDTLVLDRGDVELDGLTIERATPRIKACSRSRLCSSSSSSDDAAVRLTVEAIPPPAWAISS